MTKEELQRIQDETVALLVELQRFHLQDLLNRYPAQSSGDLRETRKAIWRAREHVRREHGIVFGQVPGASGLYDRLSPAQIAKQARHQRQAGGRKIQRALEKTDLAASTTADATERDRLSKEADRQRLRIVLGRRRTPPLPGLED